MDTLPLFDRQPYIDVAENHADATFLARYEAFIIEYLTTHDDAIGEDISTAYKQRKDLPQPREWRAVGGTYQRLQRQMVIENTHSYRVRANGSASAVYKLRK